MLRDPCISGASNEHEHLSIHSDLANVRSRTLHATIGRETKGGLLERQLRPTRLLPSNLQSAQAFCFGQDGQENPPRSSLRLRLGHRELLIDS
jgi:hypothetical protein